VSFRGLFEFDDVMHNALGTALVVLIVLEMRWLVKRFCFDSERGSDS